MVISENTGTHKRYELRNRYMFRGKIVMQTALHIGGGKATLSSSDSPVVLTPEQQPFIPGSSFKGALRSTIEKLVPGLPESARLSSCALFELNKEEIKERRTREQKICSTARQKEITDERREKPGEAAAILERAVENLCDTCHLFGSPFAAARVNISDLYLSKDEWARALQIRDGVAIDRDSEKAKDRLKYDFEVVPASTAFDLEMVLENASKQDLQLLCIGLSEFVHGFGALGGKRSRGLGVSRLENLRVWELDLEIEDRVERDKRLLHFLVSRTFSREEIPGEEFLRAQIESIFQGGVA